LQERELGVFKGLMAFLPPYEKPEVRGYARDARGLRRSGKQRKSSSILLKLSQERQRC